MAGKEKPRKPGKTNWETIALVAVLVVAAGVFAMGVWNMVNLFKTPSEGLEGAGPAAASAKPMAMGMTKFDEAKARALMDKNNDGRCDSCGMPIDQCISGGMMECTMGVREFGIDVLKSEHVHGYFKVFVDGKEINLARPEWDHMKAMAAGSELTSSFIHVHMDEQDGGMKVHRHAGGVQLWLFFESIGGELSNDCIAIDGKKYCAGDGKTLKFFVNGKKADGDAADYVLKDNDKMLLSFGAENEDVSTQLAEVEKLGSA